MVLKSNLLYLSVLTWRDAGVGFEIFAEGELLGEAEAVGNLLYLQIGLQQVFGLPDGEDVYPLHGGVARVLMNEG